MKLEWEMLNHMLRFSYYLANVLFCVYIYLNDDFDQSSELRSLQ